MTTTLHHAPASPPAHILQKGSGPTVLLLHGWGASIELFQPIIEQLSPRFHVVALDFPGFGKTPPPPSAWAVDDYVSWLLGVMDSLDIQQAHLVGHSFGGRVAIKLASQQPQRVAKLVLTDSAGIKPKRSLSYHARVRAFKLLRGLAQSPLMPAVIQRWASARVASAGSSDYQQASGSVRGSFVRVVNEDLREYLPLITAPTLLIWGDQDEDTPLADAKLMESLLPDAGLVVFEGAGHYAYLEQAARFCKIVETFFVG
ncbi:MAG: alpha/beta hydrolase [Ardenticatenales bacterium]|nr:alpha/beta hydrolase [Ardenticatenales bacterium]